MMIIHKSILKELSLTFIISIISLNFTLIMEKILKLSKIFSGVEGSVIDILGMIFYLQFQILIFTIPMSLLISILITYGRLNDDNELIILRNAGLSFKQIALPVIYLGIFCLLISFSISFKIGPESAKLLKTKTIKIISANISTRIEENIFNTTFKNIIFLVKEKPAQEKLRDIFMINEQKGEQKIITAKNGNILQDDNAIGFLLNNGNIFIIKKDSLINIKFSNYYFSLNLPTDSTTQKPAELTPSELLNESNKSSREEKNQFLIELHRRFSLPALCLIITLIGIPLALLFSKSGRLGGFAIGLLVFVVYYIILLYGENLVRLSRLPHYIGSWLSFIILSISSILIFKKANNK